MHPANLQRAYDTFVICREVIRNSSSETQLLHSLCDVFVAKLGYRLAWFGSVNRAAGRVEPVAQAGYEDGYLDTIHITWSEDEHGAGPTGRAIREDRPAVCRDIATDPRFEPWRADALKRGYASSAAFPFSDGSGVIGALNLYASEPDAFDDDELALLEEMVTDLELGVQRHRTERDLETMQARVERALSSEVVVAATLTLTHDLSNLLQIVDSSLELCKLSGDEPARMRALDSARAATDSLTILSRKLLSLGRRTLVGASSADVDQSIRHTNDLLGRLARKATVELTLDAEHLRAAIDPIDIERILINLVINAGHAMPQGGCIRISTARRDLAGDTVVTSGRLAEGAYIALTVADDGEGIADDILPHIFEPYFTTKDQIGTGLGLPAVLSMVRQVGGGIVLDTQVGAGTQVTVLVPLSESS